MSTAILVTDLWPTRYEAFDHLETWCIFRPAPDGTFWYCRRDGRRTPLANIGGASTCAVFHGDAGYLHAQQVNRSAEWHVEASKGGSGARFRGLSASEAITKACGWLGMAVPDLAAIEAAIAAPGAATPPRCNLHDCTPVEACERVCRCGHRCGDHADRSGQGGNCAPCKAAGKTCHGPVDPEDDARMEAHLNRIA